MKNRKMFIEFCNKTAPGDLGESLSVKCGVQEPDCNSLKREWLETISIQNSSKNSARNSGCSRDPDLDKGLFCFKMIGTCAPLSDDRHLNSKKTTQF